MHARSLRRLTWSAAVRPHHGEGLRSPPIGAVQSARNPGSQVRIGQDMLVANGVAQRGGDQLASEVTPHMLPRDAL